MKKLFLITLLLFCALGVKAQKAIMDEQNTLEVPNVTLDLKDAQNIFNFFSHSELFIWKGDGNNCEDRANAVSLILDGWKIPNFKSWIFTADFLGKSGGKLLTVVDSQNDNNKITWKFHVATVIPYKHGNEIRFAVIDPAILNEISDLKAWGDAVTVEPSSYYFLTTNKAYMWNERGKKLSKATFNYRNGTNYEWTIQGVAGFNGLNGKHRRIMETSEGKEKLRVTRERLEALIAREPETVRRP